MDYRSTLNLPKTDFPMRAGLPVREPEQLAKWESNGLYHMLRRNRVGRTKFVLHDGPPYANGDIHTGTALNKIVKDMINRYWSLQGYDVAYVPGWDTHGLPIEMRALKSLGVTQHQIESLALREECARVANHYIGAMTDQFRRLGVMGDWDHPYITMKPVYEGAELRVFADMVEKGLVYRDLKPVYWCPHCETALAEGEIEYKAHRSDSIYVAFLLKTASLLPEDTRAVIWTTTPWTIPANVAIAVHPDLVYQVVETDAGRLLIGRDLVKEACAQMGITAGTVLGEWHGRELEGIQTVHPYLGHVVPIVLGQHVTQESGTGLVHTAPGHGMEDFEVGKQYGLPVVQPLNDQGHYQDDTPLVAGLFYKKANSVVKDELQAKGALLKSQVIEHQYAHCWRCKNPVIYRATAQWFLSIDKIRGQLLDAIAPVRWDPEWGRERMRSMVDNRADWCLSRQRVWGVPIPAFYCESCGQSILAADLIRRTADRIAEHGSNIWWQEPASAFLPSDYHCPHCQGTTFRSERDIFDVWLDSGSSQAAVLADHADLAWPADLVLEGNDQYRGWFNSLLTTGVATRDQAPYKMVLTHGMVLDKSGQEMHKSLGNTVDPLELVNRYGADILRLWVASSDFRTDVRISDDLMQQMAETYRKIRNTFRFMLGNLAGYDPSTSGQRHEDLTDPLNRWAVNSVNKWLNDADRAYSRYAFHTVVHGLVRLMTIDLSSFYFDVIKDRLYTLHSRDPLRQETQEVLYYILQTLVRAIAPILVFTAEEVFHFAPKLEATGSIHEQEWYPLWSVSWSEDDQARWTQLFGYRDAILKSLESLRSDKVIGNSLQGEVLLEIPADAPDLSAEDVALLAEMTLSASVAWKRGESLRATAHKTTWARCERCWRYTSDVGTHSGDYADVCGRCYVVLTENPA